MWEYFLYVCLLCLILIVLECVILRLIKLNTKWDRSTACLVGKTAIVTGANTGIGFYTAQEFAKRGARVILACRSATKGEEAKKKIVEATHNENVHVRIVDFESLKSVREFARGINKSEERLDILVNNAGAVIFKNEITVDGLSKSMQVNHFGPFLLTLLLIDLLKRSRPSRIVNVSSTKTRGGRIHINNLNYYSDSYRSRLTFSNYANAKLCHLSFSNELGKRLRPSGVIVNSLHPGTVQTDITRDFSSVIQQMYKALSYFFKNSEEGAQTTIYVALSKDTKDVVGKFFYNCGRIKMPTTARNSIVAKQLWEKSMELVQLKETECPL
ncbi:hypothetical protein RI129_007584 [Pyrocoelia pectoralis]|uniref:Retinol dehydrogenase 12 n=1 Tax=Pyrocoelia pectoralis TaxID=417401 RepID=A0AAN7VGR1_9COLE